MLKSFPFQWKLSSLQTMLSCTILDHESLCMCTPSYRSESINGVVESNIWVYVYFELLKSISKFIRNIKVLSHESAYKKYWNCTSLYFWGGFDMVSNYKADWILCIPIHYLNISQILFACAGLKNWPREAQLGLVFSFFFPLLRILSRKGGPEPFV